jgi:hypothetical protein
VRSNNDREGGRERGEGLTSSRILQIVNKDCLVRAEDSFVANHDPETEASDWRK